MPSLKNREDRARRALIKCGYRLHKTPSRSYLRDWYGPGYMVTHNNVCVLGGISRAYDCSFGEVEAFVAEKALQYSHG